MNSSLCLRQLRWMPVKKKYNMQVNNVTATPYCLVQRNETMNIKGEQESSCELFEVNITAFARNV
jgi:hypothetical protein